MDSFEINKILGALLGTLMFTLALSIVAGGIFAPKMPAKPGYEIAVVETPAAGAAQAAVQPDEPIETLLAKADPQRGANAAKKCVACHAFEKGGPNKVGPNLWDIVGRPRASRPGFAYSAALQVQAAANWTFDDLNKFIANPRSYVPGTSMAFVGVPRGGERADVIAYLNTLLRQSEAATQGGGRAQGGNAAGGERSPAESQQRPRPKPKRSRRTRPGRPRPVRSLRPSKRPAFPLVHELLFVKTCASTSRAGTA